MHLEFDRERMLRLMEDFYMLSGMKIALFDAGGNELLAYPLGDCAFCSAMKGCTASRKRCKASDMEAVSRCLREQKMRIYHCHAGLIEAVAPLVISGASAGCLMIGQATDLEEELALQGLMHRGSELCGKALQPKDAPVIKTAPQLRAAAHLMDACAGYVIGNAAVQLRHPALAARLRSYLLEHLSEDLPLSAITKALGVGKSRLYQICEAEYGMSVVAYLRHLRIQRGKELLSGSRLTIGEIAQAVGFGDYNYFCRVFRKETGLTPKSYRKQSQSL